MTHPHESVLGLELLLRSLVIVDETETSRSATTELGLKEHATIVSATTLRAPTIPSPTHLEAEDGNSLLVGLVQSSQLLAELRSRDRGSGGVEDVKNELLSVEQSVGDELSGSEGNRAGGILGKWESRWLVLRRCLRRRERLSANGQA